MRALSARQVKTCEESTRPRCKCRCHGMLHGIQQGEYRQATLRPEDEDLHLREQKPEAA